MPWKGLGFHALGRGHLVPARVLRLLHELLDRGGSAHVGEEVEEDRHRLEPVSVAIDHRMAELRTHRRRAGATRVGHDAPPCSWVLGQAAGQVKPTDRFKRRRYTPGPRCSDTTSTSFMA